MKALFIFATLLASISTYAAFVTSDSTLQFRADGSNWISDNVVDNLNSLPNTAPTITLTGSSSISYTVDATYSELGATCSDSEDGTITVPAPSFSPSLDMTTAGTYTASYTCTDVGSLTDTVQRTVYVNSSGDRVAIMAALGIDVNPQPTGTTYYLDNTHGSASDSNDGLSASTPWLTLNKALTTLAAGDMVLCNGTYTHPADIEPSNSGTDGNPIIYRASTHLGCVIDQQGVNDGFRLGQNITRISYLVIDGLEIKNTYGDRNEDGGGAVFTKNQNVSIHILNSYLHGMDGNSGGNVGGVRFDQQTGGVVYNTIIENVRVSGVASNNAAGVHGYGQDGVILAFNKISDVYNGLDAKNSTAVDNWTLVGNDVSVDAVGWAVYANVIGAGGSSNAITNTKIYNNIFRSGHVYFKTYEQAPQSDGLVIRNNVLLTEGVILYGTSGVEIYDNVFDFAGSGSESGITITTEKRTQATTITYSDYNNFTLAPTFTTNRYNHDGGAEVKAMSFAAWQAQSSGDGFGTILYDNPDSNSYALDPQLDTDNIAQNAALAEAGRFGGRVGLEYQAGPDWSAP